METRWLYTTSPDLKALCEESKGVCVIPVGCVEKHGLHLPLGQDIIQASTIAYEASQLETVAIFPDFTFGDVSGGSPNIPEGTVNLRLPLRNKLLLAMCELLLVVTASTFVWLLFIRSSMISVLAFIS